MGLDVEGWDGMGWVERCGGVGWYDMGRDGMG